MPGVNVGWSESAPANGDNAGLGAQEIRSLKTAVRSGLDAEHSWPSAGGAGTGAHRIGSARAHYATESRVSSADTDGRLMVSSDRSRLFHVGSTGTMFLGGADGLQINGSGGASDILINSGFRLPQTHYWALDAKFDNIGSTGTKVVTFNSGYSGIPAIWVQGISGTAQLLTWHVTGMSQTTCTVYGFTSSGSAGNNTPFHIFSMGSRVLG